MTNFPTSGHGAPGGELSRKVRRELEARGVDVNDPEAVRRATGSIDVIIPGMPRGSQSSSTGSLGMSPVPLTRAEARAAEAAQANTAGAAGAANGTGGVPLTRRERALLEQQAATPNPSQYAPVTTPPIQGTGVPSSSSPTEELRRRAAAYAAEMAQQPQAPVVPPGYAPPPPYPPQLAGVTGGYPAQAPPAQQVYQGGGAPAPAAAPDYGYQDPRSTYVEPFRGEEEAVFRASASTGAIPTTGHTLVLSNLPENEPSVIRALNQTGQILITGQITLPAGVAQVGADVTKLDTAELDLTYDVEVPITRADLAPVSATNAVSSAVGAVSTNIQIHRKAERLPVVLAVSAAVLAIAVAGVFIAHFVFQVF